MQKKFDKTNTASIETKYKQWEQKLVNQINSFSKSSKEIKAEATFNLEQESSKLRELASKSCKDSDIRYQVLEDYVNEELGKFYNVKSEIQKEVDNMIGQIKDLKNATENTVVNKKEINKGNIKKSASSTKKCFHQNPAQKSKSKRKNK